MPFIALYFECSSDTFENPGGQNVNHSPPKDNTK